MTSKAAKPLRPPRLRMKDELLKVFLRAPVKHICSGILLKCQRGKLGRAEDFTCLWMQESPDLAPFLEETFHGTSPTIAAQRAPRSAAAAASDMLTLGFEDELTEEEELVRFSIPSTASATPMALCLLKAGMLSIDVSPDVQRLELESVKRERRALMDSLAALKADQGSAGNERQMADIARLRHELKSKQEKVNELKQARMAPFQDVSLAWHANAFAMPECASPLLCSAYLASISGCSS